MKQGEERNPKMDDDTGTRKPELGEWLREANTGKQRQGKYMEKLAMVNLLESA